MDLRSIGQLPAGIGGISLPKSSFVRQALELPGALQNTKLMRTVTHLLASGRQNLTGEELILGELWPRDREVDLELDRHLLALGHHPNLREKKFNGHPVVFHPASVLREIRFGSKVVGLITQARGDGFKNLITTALAILDLDICDKDGVLLAGWRDFDRATEVQIRRLQIMCENEDLARLIAQAAVASARRAIGEAQERGLHNALRLPQDLDTAEDVLFGSLRELGVRLYRTTRGFRVLITSCRLPLSELVNLELIGVLHSVLRADRFLLLQYLMTRLYRTRLTPKPARARGAPARAAAFIANIGSEVIVPEFAPLIEEHDRTTQALADDPDLPLA